MSLLKYSIKIHSKNQGTDKERFYWQALLSLWTELESWMLGITDITHWIWMTKRPGATADNGFILKKIYKKSKEKREKKILLAFFK